MRLDTNRKAYIIILLLVALVSANFLNHSFLHIDDYLLIVDNPNLDLSLRNLTLLLSKPFGYNFGPAADNEVIEVIRYNYYRPVQSLLLIINYKIWGINPVGFHITNILFHLLCAIFVYKVGLLLFNGDKLIALIAAAVFAVHPVNNEPLARATSGEGVLGFFMVASLYYFLNQRKYPSMLLFGLALLSKESAVMLPVVFCSWPTYAEGWKKGCARLIPYAILTVVYLVLRASVFDFVPGGDMVPFRNNILTMAVALSDYVRLLLLPYHLSPFYPARLYTDLFQPGVLFSMGLLILLIYLIWNIRKDRSLFFTLLSIAILLAPVVFKANTMIWAMENTALQDYVYIAERQLYVPTMFFSLFSAAIILKRAGNTWKNYAVFAFIAIITLFIVLSISAGKIWENDSTLFAKWLEVCPKDSAMRHEYLGEVLYKQGKLEGAMHEFRAAMHSTSAYEKIIKQSEPGRGRMHSRGKLLNTSGPNALWEYQPSFVALHFKIGHVYFAMKDFEHAIRKFKVAVILLPHFIDAHYYLGQSYMKIGQFGKARQEFQTVIKDVHNKRVFDIIGFH